MSRENPECKEEYDFYNQPPPDDIEPTDEELQDMEIDTITDDLYNAYGSGTGVLFGIPSDLRSSVRAIVKLVLEQARKKT